MFAKTAFFEMNRWMMLMRKVGLDIVNGNVRHAIISEYEEPRKQKTRKPGQINQNCKVWVTLYAKNFAISRLPRLDDAVISPQKKPLFFFLQLQGLAEQLLILWSEVVIDENSFASCFVESNVTSVKACLSSFDYELGFQGTRAKSDKQVLCIRSRRNTMNDINIILF